MVRSAKHSRLNCHIKQVLGAEVSRINKNLYEEDQNSLLYKTI